MASVYTERDDALNQGDIFEDVTFSIPHGDERSEETMPGLVISHHCDCDKFFNERKKAEAYALERYPVAVAPVYPITKLEGGKPGDAREGRIKRFFYIAAEGDHPELVADLYFEQPVAVVKLLQLERRACLSDDYLKRLHILIWELRTRIPAEEAFGGESGAAGDEA